MASDFWLIAGLGNPGKKYEDTRHNMGFMTADVLAERWTVNFADHKGLAMLGKSVMNLDGRTVKFFLAKPLTYMNDSGNAVASISAYYQIEPDHIVVIHDDMEPPCPVPPSENGPDRPVHSSIHQTCAVWFPRLR